MTTYELEPEVPGTFGDEIDLDTSVHPPIVRGPLIMEFDDWAGDDIVTTFPVYLVTPRLRDALVEAGVTGVAFAPAQARKSEQAEEMWPDLELPEWSWMQVTGTQKEDAWTGRDFRLTVSQRFWDVLSRFSLSECDVTRDPA